MKSRKIDEHDVDVSPVMVLLSEQGIAKAAEAKDYIEAWKVVINHFAIPKNISEQKQLQVAHMKVLAALWKLAKNNSIAEMEYAGAALKLVFPKAWENLK